jgi:hypothetical protein
MIRTILAPVTGNRPDAAGLVTAFLVAKAFQAHVDALCVTPHPELRAPIEAASIPAPLARRLVALATEEQARAAASARSVFNEISGKHGGSGNWSWAASRKTYCAGTRACRSWSRIEHRCAA